ncbi:kinase-like domain-containing protein [Amylostereum chailletii]|nr:kinase-like domain-containing protein [Amylostereum chailletii]
MSNLTPNFAKIYISPCYSASTDLSPCPSSAPSPIFSTSSAFTSITDAATTVGDYCESPPRRGTRNLNTDDFEILSRLGRGAHGQVFHARDKLTGQHVALKVIEKITADDGEEIDQIEEQRIMLLLQGEHGVVQLFGSWHDDKYYYLAMELCNSGDLARAIENSLDAKLPVDRVRIYAAQLLAALECMHLKGILHHDIKPENILLDDAGNAVLTDFGLAEQLSGPDYQTTRECGTYSYMSPELLAGNAYSFEADLWALGAVVYQALTGKVAFDGEDIADVAIAILLNDIEFDEAVDATAQNFLRRVLNRDISQRPTIAEMKADPFFANVNWEAITASSIQTSPVLEEGRESKLENDVDFTPGTPYAPGCNPLPFFHFVSSTLELPTPVPVLIFAPPLTKSAQSQSYNHKPLPLWYWIVARITAFSLDLLRLVIDATKRPFSRNGIKSCASVDIEAGMQMWHPTVTQSSESLHPVLSSAPASHAMNSASRPGVTTRGLWVRLRPRTVNRYIKWIYGVETREDLETTMV